MFDEREPGGINFTTPHFVYLRLIQLPDGINSPEAEAYYEKHKDYPDFIQIAARHRMLIRVLTLNAIADMENVGGAGI